MMKEIEMATIRLRGFRDDEEEYNNDEELEPFT